MNLRRLVWIALMALPTLSARADWDSTVLTCYSLASNNAWAEKLNSATGGIESTSTSEVTNAAEGFVFESESDKVECVWSVPVDYDTDSVDPPYITLSGWSRDTSACIFSCPSTRTVRLKVASRVYSDGSYLNTAWSNEVNGDFSFTGVGSGTVVYKEDTLHVVSNLAVTADAGDFSTFRTVFFRIQRDATVTNNLPVDFYLATMTLNYMTD